MELKREYIVSVYFTALAGCTFREFDGMRDSRTHTPRLASPERTARNWRSPPTKRTHLLNDGSSTDEPHAPLAITESVL